MSDTENRGLRDAFTAATPFNQLEFIIERKIREMINTSALVRVDSCTSSGPSAPAGEVSATPLVAQTDGQGNALPMTIIPRMPHYRVQAGIAALVIDPVPGDIGVVSFCKADSSTVGVGTAEPQRPGSLRCFDLADGMLVASVSNRAPQVWIEIKQDKTIVIHAPEGCTVETDKDVTVNAGQSVTVSAGQSITLDAPQTVITGNLTATGEKGGVVSLTGTVSLAGSLTSTGDQVAGGISQTGHTHTGVQPGSGSTGGPQ